MVRRNLRRLARPCASIVPDLAIAAVARLPSAATLQPLLGTEDTAKSSIPPFQPSLGQPRRVPLPLDISAGTGLSFGCSHRFTSQDPTLAPPFKDSLAKTVTSRVAALVERIQKPKYVGGNADEACLVESACTALLEQHGEWMSLLRDEFVRIADACARHGHDCQELV